MSKSRLEAFSDGVIAIIITIMVLELRPPHGADFESLRPLLPVFLSYVLSFVYVGIYWNNHHHLLQSVREVTGWILWANLYLLFWLSLFPFATAWVGESHGESLPSALYGFVLMMAGAAYQVLEYSLIRHHGKESMLARALGRTVKEWLSVAGYTVGIGLAFFEPRLSWLVYVAIALSWFIPDRRIEALLSNAQPEK